MIYEPGTWRRHALSSGPVAVIDPRLTLADYEAVTRTQISLLEPALRGLVRGPDRAALDWGCGAGRFTPMLARLAGRAVGYDPCLEMLALAPAAPGASYVSTMPRERFGLVFVWCVLGGIADDALPASAAEVLAALAPGGLLIVADHMDAPRGLQWRFRSAAHYAELFAPLRLARKARVAQHGHWVELLAGRS